MVEFGLSLWDAYELVGILTDDCASDVAKYASTAMFLTGILAVGGGGVGVVKHADDVADLAKAARSGGLSAELANAPHIAKGNRPPYALGTRARDIVLEKERAFVRVHGEGNKARSWMMREREIQGLSPTQIKDKFALPEMPTHISDVHVPAGTKIRTGTVGAQEGWGTGGGIQYELLERLPESAFRNTRGF